MLISIYLLPSAPLNSHFPQGFPTGSIFFPAFHHFFYGLWLFSSAATALNVTAKIRSLEKAKCSGMITPCLHVLLPPSWDLSQGPQGTVRLQVPWIWVPLGFLLTYFWTGRARV